MKDRIEADKAGVGKLSSFWLDKSGLSDDDKFLREYACHLSKLDAPLILKQLHYE